MNARKKERKEMVIQEGSNNIPQQAFVRWNDPQGNRLVSINRDGTVSVQGILFPDGTEQGTSGTNISNFPSGNPALSGDLILVERAGVNYSLTAGSIAALITGSYVPLVGGIMTGSLLFSPLIGSGSALDALTVELSETAASTWDWNFQDGGIQPGTGKHDWTGQFGYNVSNNYTKKATESANYIGIESNYEQNQGVSSSSQTEGYITCITPNLAGGGPAIVVDQRVISWLQKKSDGTTNVTLQATTVNIGNPGFTSVLFSGGQMVLGGTLISGGILADCGYAPKSANPGGTAGNIGAIVMHNGVLYFCSATGAAGSATWNSLSMTGV